MEYRNLSPVLAELLVLQFEQVCTLPVHNSATEQHRRVCTAYAPTKPT